MSAIVLYVLRKKARNRVRFLNLAGAWHSEIRSEQLDICVANKGLSLKVGIALQPGEAQCSLTAGRKKLSFVEK
jgi:hypothetical protein